VTLFASLLRFLRLWRKTYITKYRRTFYSQFGEDVILAELVGKRAPPGFYVDVGCFHPKKFSNTYLLHKRGWQGINVDMEADKIFCFGLARPRDHNVVAAVSDTPGTVTLAEEGRYSLGARIASVDAAAPGGGRAIETRTLDSIIEASPFAGRRIDLLTIDAEGMDWNVLNSLDLDRYRPQIIVIEEHSKDIEAILQGRIYRTLKARGYRLHSWVHLSLIFVLDE